mgnify:CR=1 FL=1
MEAYGGCWLKMKFRNIGQIIFGILTFIPGVYSWRAKKLGSGGSYSSRYCYSVWMRHIVLANNCNLGIRPKIVAELGPGDSLGIGIMSLLLGAEKYYAFDVVPFASSKKNLNIMRELLVMVNNREPIPGDKEFPRIRPKLEDYSFPFDIYSEDYLSKCLTKSRIKNIHDSINLNKKMIEYVAPWNNDLNIKHNFVDMIVSQAVLEHIDDLDNAYEKMKMWLKDDGFISHCVDFKSHGYSDSWDGHWNIPDWLWKLIRGNRPYLINREPYSTHERIINDCGFKMLESINVYLPSSCSKSKLSKRFIYMKKEDRVTSGACIVLVKG